MIRNFRWLILGLAAVATVVWACVAVGQPQNGWMSLDLSLAKGPAILFDAITFALFCIVLTFGVTSGRSSLKSIFGKALKIFAWFAGLGLAVALAAHFTKFQAPAWMAVAAVALSAVGLVAIYFKDRKNAGRKTSSSAIRRSATGSGQIRHCYSVLYASLFLVVLADLGHFINDCIVAHPIEIYMDVAVALLALILWRVIKWRGILLPAIAYNLLALLLTVYNHAVAQPVDYSMAAANAISSVILSGALIVSLCDLYCRKENNI